MSQPALLITARSLLSFRSEVTFMRRQLLSHVYGLGLLLVGACGPSSELTLDLTRLDLIEPNDVMVNGLSVNGLSVNGLSVNGLSVNGLSVNSSSTTSAAAPPTTRPIDLASVRFETLTLFGKYLDDAQINQSTIEAKSDDTRLSGGDLIGAQFSGKLLDGTSIPLRIEDVQVESGVSLYSISVLSDYGPMPLCGTAAGSPIPAIAVPGYWDQSATYVDESDSFTFGCINAAVGKCVRWGYQTWATKSECRNNSCRTRKLQDWHHACVRLVRADYCGDGIAHTRSGTRINVYDQLNIQPSANPGWSIEAEWGQDGGSCIGHTRWAQANSAWSETDLAYVQRVCPDRLASAKSAKCDPDKSTFNTQFGFNKSSSDRPLIRNESPQYQ